MMQGDVTVKPFFLTEAGIIFAQGSDRSWDYKCQQG